MLRTRNLGVHGSTRCDLLFRPSLKWEIDSFRHGVAEILNIISYNVRGAIRTPVTLPMRKDQANVGEGNTNQATLSLRSSEEKQQKHVDSQVPGSNVIVP